ncbi:septum formation family protein, partial [Streptomyces sp. ME18-1-4]|uniref:septum formation family protein n=1 Tax=Streptomyces sp. ME18-1-4 TaxID=3028685 RepID=UPI0029A0F887
ICGACGTAPEPPPPPRFHKPRRSRGGLVALLAVVALLIGGGVWAGTSLTSGGGAGGTNTPSPTGPVPLYGENVDLTKELKPGDCVSAVWGQGKLKGEPTSVGLVDCVKQEAKVDGQVLKTDPATSLDDAKSNGAGRCAALLNDTVRGMAEAQSYALVPNEQGWDGGVHSTACLIFDRTVALYGPVGSFRHVGDDANFTNNSVGDCINEKPGSGDTVYLYLADCAAAHTEQVVGFVKAPGTLTYTALTNGGEASKLCSNKYSATYVKDPNEDLYGWINDEDWKGGFRYVMCTVYRTDGKKLTGDVTSPVSFSGFSSGVFGLAP